jgi:branched-chain amino acid transport system substrate-binding protein
MMLTHRRKLSAAVGLVLTASAVSACSSADEESGVVKVGVLATAEGNLAFGIDEAKAAIGVAAAAYEGDVNGATVGGTKVEFVYEGTDGTSGSAQTAVKKLVEQEDVDIVLGPASGDEGETIVQYAATVPEVTFVNGSASPVGMTLEGTENFFRFIGDSAMWMGGLGTYAYEKKGYKKIYSIAEDYSFPYDNAGGFFSEFCDAGGKVTGNSWVPVGTTDYATVISQIPQDTDAVYVGLGGADAASFLAQAVTAGLDKPLVGGTIAVDTTALSGDVDVASAATGMISGGPIPGDDYFYEDWKTFSADYAEQPKAFPSPSIFALLYYNETVPLLQAIEKVKGDLGNNQQDLRDALSKTNWESPTGNITLDKNRQAIVNNFISEVEKGSDGALRTRAVIQADGVKQGTVVYDRFNGCP